MHYTQNSDWLYTSNGDPRGYIQPQSLRELWFHTGTICNLACPFCLEGSKPGDTRIESLTFVDAKKYIDEALSPDFDIRKFCFTGGEPFVIKDILQILDYALNYRPCLVLTNGTDPIIKRMSQVLSFQDKPHSLNFRLSLDYPDPEKHDEARGAGNFDKTLRVLSQLHQHGFGVSLACQLNPGENLEQVRDAYRPFLKSAGVDLDVPVIGFPDLLPPYATAEVPEITESCITTYKDEPTRAEFMCNYSKMIVKQDGITQVVACTLVDDDPEYHLGTTLRESMPIRVMLKHHRCFACFSTGTSCSE